MIDESDRRLTAWAQGVLGTVDVSLAPPAGETSGSGVGLYLLELLPQPTATGAPLPPHQLVLRYLVTTWSDEPLEAHRLLGELAFAAFDSPDVELEHSTLPASTWTALGVPPRPSIVLRAPLRRDRPKPPVKPVLEPLVLRGATLRPFDGVVLGPRDTPLAGASVDVPALELHTVTDGRGRFRLAGVPAGAIATTIRVRAKGAEVSVTIDGSSTQQPLVVRVDPLEGGDA